MSFQEEHVDYREEYLHQGGCEDTENPLYEQEWVRNDTGMCPCMDHECWSCGTKIWLELVLNSTR